MTDLPGSASALAGKRVVVTRARAQASDLSRQLGLRGAEPIEIPTISIADPADGGAALRDAVANLDRYTWVVLTSTNGAARFCETLGQAHVPAGVLVAAIGPGTAAQLGEGGVHADLVPEVFVAEEFLKAFPPPPERGRVALVRATHGRNVLPEGLGAAGWEVDIVAAYTTVAAKLDDAAAEALQAADVVTFTSSSTVRNFIELVGEAAVPPAVACIGPATAQTARDLGLQVDIEATDHTITGLVKALEAYFSA